MDHAIFDASIDPLLQPDDHVRRVGPVFECGEYPDKQFSLTPEEADAAIAAFQPLDANLEHVPTVLNGKLGKLTRLERVGNVLHAVADVPEWLDRQLEGTGRHVSLEWDRTTKQLVGWGWVRHPRVAGAALMSAYFSTHPTEEPMNETTSVAKPETPGAAAPGTTLHVEPSTPSTGLAVSSTTMASTLGTLSTAGFAAASEVSALRAQLAALQDARRRERAALFTHELITQNHLLPAHRATAIALFSQALADDDAGPATFSVGDGTVPIKRAETLFTLLAANEAHLLTHEVLPASFGVLAAPTESGANQQAKLIEQTRAAAVAYAESVNAKKKGR